MFFMSKEFIWNDKLVMEFVRELFDRNTFPLLPEIDKFKASHSTDKIKWEAGTVVKDTWYNAEYTKQEDGSWIRSKTSPRFVITDNEIGVGLRYVPISKLPQRTKLFDCEDGSVIYEGDTFFLVQKRTFNVLTSCRHKPTDLDQWHFFTTYDKAKEFVLMNKPLLSVKDFENLCKNKNWFVHDVYTKELKELAKSKL